MYPRLRNRSDALMHCKICGKRKRFIRSRPKLAYMKPTFILICTKCDGTSGTRNTPVNVEFNFVEGGDTQTT